MENLKFPRQRIIQESTKLFAKKGFEGTTIRDITELADVNIASVNYHFGSKQGLLDAIIGEHLIPINQQRLELLNNLRSKNPGKTLPLEEIYEAYLGPVFKGVKQETNGHDFLFIQLLTRAMSESEEYAKKIFQEHFKTVHEVFIKEIQASLPDLNETDLNWCYHFALSLMKSTLLQRNQINVASRGICDPDDIDGILRRLIAFICGGYRASLSGALL